METGVREGLDSLREGLQSLHDQFDYESLEVLELDEGPGGLLVVARLRASGRSSGVPIDETFTHVFGLRDGQVVSYRWFRTREEGLAAAGLAVGHGPSQRECLGRLREHHEPDGLAVAHLPEVGALLVDDRAAALRRRPAVAGERPPRGLASSARTAVEPRRRQSSHGLSHIVGVARPASGGVVTDAGQSGATASDQPSLHLGVVDVEPRPPVATPPLGSRRALMAIQVLRPASR